MNFTSSILNSCIKNHNTILTILVVDKEKEEFINFLKQLNHRFVYYNDLYFGGIVPNLLLCNNKIDYYHECKELSINYHIPSIIIDHNIKNDIYDNDKIKFLDNLPCSTKVAINRDVYNSWHFIHDKVLPFSSNNMEQLNSWAELLHTTNNREFVI